MTKLTNPETETQEAIGIASETPETPLPDFELETFFPTGCVSFIPTSHGLFQRFTSAITA